MNYPILSITIFEYNKKQVTKNINLKSILTEDEKEKLLDKIKLFLEKEFSKTSKAPRIGRREGN